MPGQDQLEQVHRIINIVGTPTESEMGFISNESAKK